MQRKKPSPKQVEHDLQQMVEMLDQQVSEVVKMASQIMQLSGAYNILCPACGPGNSGGYLARQGFQVTAYDVAESVVRRAGAMAAMIGAPINCFVDDIVIPKHNLRQFDGLFAPDVLHQLKAQERRRLLRTFHRSLRQGGILVVSVLSVEDERYGYGHIVEEDTFLTAAGELLHFYNVHSLHRELSQFFQVTHVEPVEEIFNECGAEGQSFRLLVATGVKYEER